MNSRDALETVKSQLEAAYEKANRQYALMPMGKDDDAVCSALNLMDEAIGFLTARIQEWQDEPTPEEFPERTYNRNGPRTFDWPDRHERDL